MARDVFRQWPTPESLGIDIPYERDRQKALHALSGTMVIPKTVPGDAGIKDPSGDLEAPASMTASGNCRQGQGPNRGDPQGQQGGTHGGQPSSPPLKQEVHPLADARQRQEQSQYNPQNDDPGQKDEIP